ncbi:MAG: hypothetical protein LBN92_04835 [Treponema sp.]|jgi:hypothetical protein|nr:hypothetical protein [Treponema sp.]
MTLAQRNRFFKGGIVLSSACLLAILFAARNILPLYAGLAEQASRRTQGVFQVLTADLFPAFPPAPFVTVVLAAIYALFASILIYFFFEKTQSPEILFFGLFTISFVFEILRFAIPLQRLYPFPAVFLILGARLLIFGRFFGVLALFASSVYAAGLDMQKQGSVIFAVVIVTLVVALGVPVDGLSWDSSLAMISAYGSMFRLAENAILLIAVLNFLVSAYTKGTKEYRSIAAGTVFVALGRTMLINSDTWTLPLAGLILLAGGTCLIAAKLHQIYLWL